jgi:glycosyltransferase involved in cell wall biosynthesis
MKKITALIPTFNEEDKLRDCLASVEWVDEILVVDSFSTDNTLEIAGQSGAQIIQHEYKSHASQLNWAIPQASHEWIILLDADEIISDELKSNIQKLLISEPQKEAYWINRKNFFFGQVINHGAWGNDRIVRFFNRKHSKFDECGYHSKLILKNKPGIIAGDILHSTYCSVDDYFRKFHLYTNEGAKLLFEKQKKASFSNLTLNPLWRFFYMYIIRCGFLDGAPGFIICALSGFYVFTKYFKLWHLKNEKPSE